MFNTLRTSSQPASRCQRIARLDFARAAGQHVPAAKRLLETWSAHGCNPVMTIDGIACASGQPGLSRRGMH